MRDICRGDLLDTCAPEIGSNSDRRKLSVKLVSRKFQDGSTDSYTETTLIQWTPVAQASASGTELSVEDVVN
jgi:hypothetical protein